MKNFLCTIYGCWVGTRSDVKNCMKLSELVDNCVLLPVLNF